MRLKDGVTGTDGGDGMSMGGSDAITNNVQVIVNTDGHILQGFDLDTSNETQTINRSKSNFESRLTKSG
jgi:hypothetical protein